MGATTTIERRSTKLSPEQIATRRRDAAIAELERRGINVPADDKPAKCIHEALAGGKYEPPIAPLPTATREFRSKPDAVEIAKSEITNFRPLTISDARRYGDAYSQAVWGTDLQTSDWGPNDVRWTLSPSEVRKLKPQTVAAMNRKVSKA